MRTAAQVQVSLAKKLIRKAHTSPEKRPEIRAILRKMGVEIPKVAVNKETSEFVRWVLSTQSPMSPQETESFITRTLNVPLRASPQKRGGPRFRHGDSVIICSAKHKNGSYDIGNYKRFDGKTGIVLTEEGMDVMVAIDGQQAPVRFPGGMEPRGVGIMKYTAPYDLKGSAKVEMIYFAGNKPTDDQKFTVQSYMARGKKTERRSANYYSGYIVFSAVGKEGFYFRGFPQQRMLMTQTCGEASAPRSFNPRVGRIYYIGVFGHRPNGWEEELEALDKAFMETTGSDQPPKPSEDDHDTRTDAEVLRDLDMKMF